MSSTEREALIVAPKVLFLGIPFTHTAVSLVNCSFSATLAYNGVSKKILINFYVKRVEYLFQNLQPSKSQRAFERDKLDDKGIYDYVVITMNINIYK